VLSAELLNIILPAVAALIGYWLKARQPAPAPGPNPPPPGPAPAPSDKPLLDLLLRLLRGLTPQQMAQLEAQAAPASVQAVAPGQEVFFRVEVTPPQVVVHQPK
jgi:hypothetical protein